MAERPSFQPPQRVVQRRDPLQTAPPTQPEPAHRPERERSSTIAPTWVSSGWGASTRAEDGPARLRGRHARRAVGHRRRIRPGCRHRARKIRDPRRAAAQPDDRHHVAGRRPRHPLGQRLAGGDRHIDVPTHPHRHLTRAIGHEAAVAKPLGVPGDGAFAFDAHARRARDPCDHRIEGQGAENGEGVFDPLRL
jgi:hypothetical protein